VNWLVYRLTHSALLLGVVGFASQIPALFCSPLGGVIADRYDKRVLVIATQGLAMVQAAVLCTLVLRGTIRIWEIIVLGSLWGLINAFDIPIRQSFMIDLIDEKEDLSNAIALNSSMVNVARLVGPSVAGVLIAATGEGVCFLINALSYLPVIVALFLIRVTPQLGKAGNKRPLKEMAEGFHYASHFAPIKAILLLLAVIGLVGAPYMVLMPVFVKDVFHAGPHTFGLLVGTAGLGALIGAFYLAARKTVRGLGRVMALMPAVFGISLIGFSFSQLLWVALIFILLCGFGMMVHMAASNIVLQTIVENDKRGRIMSFYAMALMGMMPLGSLLAGWLASRIGAPHTLMLKGFGLVAGALIFAKSLPALREEVRPIYAQKGIIPEVAVAIQSATGMQSDRE
jgi:MFS family permease